MKKVNHIMVDPIHPIRKYSACSLVELAARAKACSQFICLVILLGCCGTLEAKNYFVRPGGTGTKNGADWDNAWDGSAIGKLSPGDCVYLAGGTYSNIKYGNSSGSSTNPIIFRKVLKTDSEAIAATGWKESFDSTVTTNSGSSYTGTAWVTIDGRIPGGIIWKIVDGDLGLWISSCGDGIRIQYINFKGPGWGPYGNYAVNLTSGGNHYVGHCVFDGVIQQLSFGGGNNITVEYCQFLNAGPGTSSSHSDMIYIGGGGSNWVFRYNYFYNSYSQAFFWSNGGGSAEVYIYGNVAIFGPNGNGRFIETYQDEKWGDFHIYNNTFAGWDTAVNFRGSTAVNSELKNNIFYHTNWANESGWSGHIQSSHNGYSSKMPSGESNSIVNTADPFVDSSDRTVSAQNWQLVAGSWPTGKGISLPAPYDKDMNGNSFANNMGAFGPGTGPAPSPAPTATPPGPTPTPSPTPTPAAKFRAGDTVTPTAIVNVRSTPAGTVLGTHKPGDTGTVQAGPEYAPLKQDVYWYQITWGTNPKEGWSGDDDLIKAVGPTPAPTPNPTPTPVEQTYDKWIKKQNDWTKANPPTPD